MKVSIQPKPKTGLEDFFLKNDKRSSNSFNPAEAEDGFRRNLSANRKKYWAVSIQPKPKTGLEVKFLGGCHYCFSCFNPAEAEDGFRRLKIGLEALLKVKFQSSRSRRRV